MKKPRFVYVSLLLVTISSSVIPYKVLYDGTHNSLYHDATYLVALTLLALLYRRDFRRFTLTKRNPLMPFGLAVVGLLLIDLAVNLPLNLYKTKMYVLLYAMFVLCFLFTKLREHEKLRVVTYLLMTWVTVSCIELYLRFTSPELFAVLPWIDMTLQSALNPLVQTGALTRIQSKVHGLGIGSQANSAAMIMTLMIVVSGGMRLMPILYRLRLVQGVILAAVVLVLPFTLSLTSVIAALCAIAVVMLRRGMRLTTAATLGLSTVVAGAIGLSAFNIGGLFGFVASTRSQGRYIYEFVGWPITFYRENFVSITLGLHNDIVKAPLENRYFNVMLALGLPLAVYIGLAVFAMFRKLMRRSLTEPYGTLRLMVFTVLTVAYVHIGFAAHLPGLILLATVFVFVTDPLRAEVTAPRRVAVAAARVRPDSVPTGGAPYPAQVRAQALASGAGRPDHQ